MFNSCDRWIGLPSLVMQLSTWRNYCKGSTISTMKLSLLQALRLLGQHQPAFIRQHQHCKHFLDMSKRNFAQLHSLALMGSKPRLVPVWLWTYAKLSTFSHNQVCFMVTFVHWMFTVHISMLPAQFLYPLLLFWELCMSWCCRPQPGGGRHPP